jgi:hypothetical protein
LVTQTVCFVTPWDIAPYVEPKGAFSPTIAAFGASLMKTFSSVQKAWLRPTPGTSYFFASVIASPSEGRRRLKPAQ